jgi:hypothetical protein
MLALSRLIKAAGIHRDALAIACERLVDAVWLLRTTVVQQETTIQLQNGYLDDVPHGSTSV